MRAPLLALLLALAFAAGCVARGSQDDAFAYLKKPLYTGHFDLERVPESGDTQMFKVTDGSIAKIRIQAWVNATSGGARVTVLDPGGKVSMLTEQTSETHAPLNLGTWTVKVERIGDARGNVGILVTRG